MISEALVKELCFRGYKQDPHTSSIWRKEIEGDNEIDALQFRVEVSPDESINIIVFSGSYFLGSSDGKNFVLTEAAALKNAESILHKKLTAVRQQLSNYIKI